MPTTIHANSSRDREALKQFMIAEAGGNTLLLSTIPPSSPFVTTRALLIQAAVDQGWPRSLAVEVYDTLVTQGRLFDAREIT